MTRFFVACVCIIAFFFCDGCRKTTPADSESTLTNPADAEEAALQVVGNLYGFYATYHKKGPTGWEDLKAQVAEVGEKTKKEALEAIKVVQVAGYKMKWGVDLPLMAKEGIKPDDYVIGESPDGRRKLMFSGNVKTTKAEE
ncbi:hypothetical protein [Gimesia aquarii]|uniref:Uncharacterized protein n=1 Tax=Gimesia aquarii TaxID=2527964 RepID=A0A517WVY7_9PLAN|nr:hypothetical protein [Gimesia aquarii]QDU09389.1 hypothetical protein V202x_27640 [Gimesia aquarii]